MRYYFKEIKEKDLASFLLNPFEKSAYLGAMLIQKLPRDPRVDDFLISNMNLTNVQRVGYVFYEKETILVDKPHLLRLEVLNHEPFISMTLAQNTFVEKLSEKIEVVKKEQLSGLKSKERYKQVYDYQRNIHFDK